VTVRVRLAEVDDADELATLLQTNRTYLEPSSPSYPDSWFTVEHQRKRLTESLAGYAEGLEFPGMIMVDDRIVGRANLHNLVRGALLSADLGYWVGQVDTGRGVATAAVRAVLPIAFDDLGLHRVQAGTLVHNVASQRVLERNGFTRIGVAPGYVKIAGQWQDHLLFQRLAEPTA
jgi:ribosomal-protein-alanine N-acetyltransferase